MPAESFGKHITHANAKAYFDRYIAMKKKHGADLRTFLKDDPDANRFFCGRHKQNPDSEDWAFVFDTESFDRLMKLITKTNADSLVIFQGVRNKEAGDPPEESNGRPTLLVFPAKFKPRKESEGDPEIEGGSKGDYEIGDDGEEHPGSGGKNGNSSSTTPVEFPKILKGEDIHKLENTE